LHLFPKAVKTECFRRPIMKILQHLLYMARSVYWKMGLNLRGVASFPSPSALNTLRATLYQEDFDGCARASALAGKFQLTRDTPTWHSRNANQHSCLILLKLETLNRNRFYCL
jgi:hypothetical protein